MKLLARLGMRISGGTESKQKAKQMLCNVTDSGIVTIYSNNVFADFN